MRLRGKEAFVIGLAPLEQGRAGAIRNFRLDGEAVVIAPRDNFESVRGEGGKIVGRDLRDRTILRIDVHVLGDTGADVIEHGRSTDESVGGSARPQQRGDAALQRLKRHGRRL